MSESVLLWEEVIYVNKKENTVVISKIDELDIQHNTEKILIKTVEGYCYESGVELREVKYQEDCDELFKLLHLWGNKQEQRIPEKVDKDRCTIIHLNSNETLYLLSWKFQKIDWEKGEKYLRCPFCKSPLRIAGQARLETLEEHVCDPNGEPSLKDMYKCPNRTCKAWSLDFVWVWMGEIFGLSWDLYRRYEREGLNIYSKNSIAWKIKNKDIREKESTYKFKNMNGVLRVKTYNRWKDRFGLNFEYWKWMDVIGGTSVHNCTGIFKPLIKWIF